MADDTVQQIVPGTSSSAVNAHPSLVQRRPQERRGSRDGEREGKDGSERGHEHSDQPVSDTVTLSSGGKSVSQPKRSGATLSPSKESPAEIAKTIDIRI